MAKSYLVMGSGMQGRAGAYYLAKHGDTHKVIMADVSAQIAEAAADRINALIGRSVAEAKQIDAKDKTQMVKEFSEVSGVFSATSYEFNLAITEAAIAAGAHLVDLGGNTDVVWSQRKLHEQALQKGVSIIPDCGLAPGLGNTLAALGIQSLDQCDEVQIRCGGLPQKPKPPLDYMLVFSIKGLTNEYFGEAAVLRNSKIEMVKTFAEREELEFDKPLGRVEAFTTSGGTSTAPWTWQGKVKTYEYKTVRYLGHYEKFKCMLDLGLLDTTPVQVGNQLVSPRSVFHAVVPSKITFPNDRDLTVLRATCSGTKNSKKAQVVFDLMDFHDEATGFSAMERTTSYPAALVLAYAVRGIAQKGVVPLETAIDNRPYFEELNATAFKITEKWS